MSGYAEWSPATAYAVNDIVYWQGVVYVCVAININQQPPNVTYWAAQGGAAGVSSLNGLQGTLTVVPGSGIAVGTIGPSQLIVSSVASTAAFTDSVGINAVGGVNVGNTYTVPATGLYLISVSATFGSGAGATPIELDESLGNYVQVLFRNTPPGSTFDGYCSVPAPPTIAAPGVGASYFTQNTTVVNWTGGVDKQFRVRVQNAGAGGISWDAASSSVAVTIVQLA